jgi:hypothetical protein
MKKIETYLPVFPGFYETIFEANEESEIEYFNDIRERKKLTPVDWNNIKFNYDMYHNDISKGCCQFIERELNEFVGKIEFQTINSPKEYNFATDAIYICVHLTQKNIANIKRFIKAHIKEFEKYIKEHYTSYDGFMSHYSNNISDWLNIDENLKHSHKTGSMLEFICQVNEVNYEDMYEYASQDARIEVECPYELENLEYCNTCNSFVNPEYFNGNCCADCFESNVQNLDVIICKDCHTEITNRNEIRHFLYQIKHHIINYSDVICSDCEVIHANI